MRFVPKTPSLFADAAVPDGTRLAGWAALVCALKAQAPVRSLCCVSAGHVMGSIGRHGIWRVFDKRYWPGDTLGDHITFALKHEPLDLLVLKRVLEKADKREVKAFILSAPTSAVGRRVWFFYETLTRRTLDIPDAEKGATVDALDAKAYFTAKPIVSRRHRVRDNLLGDGGWCPIVRRTGKLENFLREGLAEQAREMAGRAGKRLLARAAGFLLLADSQASFAIEGERPPRNRLERWGKAVSQAGRNPLQPAEIVRLHGILMEDDRFARVGLRPDSVFLGERDREQNPMPEFIGARPQDLKALMEGLVRADTRMRAGGVDAVIQAAATAFGFVYAHPFQDGNGRIHRCLIHHVLAERGFAPPDVVLPISSVMLDRIEEYRDVLRRHSGPLLDWIEWRPSAKRNVEVANDTADLYRYFDCTEVAEFLYACVTRTVERDLPEEIAWLQARDEALRRIMNAVEMPDRMAEDFVMFARQNAGRLPKRRREKEFKALTNAEVAELEAIVQDVFADMG